ncbi:hypothetical protein N7925_00125 [Streptomyces sp. CA-278952]|nr:MULTISPECIES: hypothetical protein [unclassified Streptomyces]UZI26669.1 hypothetical protein OH133_00255 [Streptomyces sp. VB1]WDG26846.1 hypothetical protein N7925_00125 [Streptomyces sp. CA-278952]
MRGAVTVQHHDVVVAAFGRQDDVRRRVCLTERGHPVRLLGHPDRL